jgi:hypothetical protein
MSKEPLLLGLRKKGAGVRRASFQFLANDLRGQGIVTSKNGPENGPDRDFFNTPRRCLKNQTKERGNNNFGK